MTTRTPIPAEFHDHGGASEKQLAFIGSLMSERLDLTSEVGVKFCRRYGELCAAGELTKSKASEIIAWLLARPKAPGPSPASVNQQLSNETIRATQEDRRALPDVPAGRYALVTCDGITKFYKVDRPDEGRWAGYIFLSAGKGGPHGDPEWVPIKNRESKRGILASIAERPAEAARLYGTELGSCGVCGRTLTDETSRAYGIGPVCRSNTGW